MSVFLQALSGGRIALGLVATAAGLGIGLWQQFVTAAALPARSARRSVPGLEPRLGRVLVK